LVCHLFFCNTSIYTALNNQWKIGLGVNLKDSQEIANALAQLLNHSDLINALSNNNLQASQRRYNWQNEATKLIELYKLLINA